MSMELIESAVVEKPSDYDEHRTHIVNPPLNLHIGEPHFEVQERVDFAREHGLELTALCGYVWVPKRDPDGYAVCMPCMDEAARIMKSLGE